MATPMGGAVETRGEAASDLQAQGGGGPKYGDGLGGRVYFFFPFRGGWAAEGCPSP